MGSVRDALQIAATRLDIIAIAFAESELNGTDAFVELARNWAQEAWAAYRGEPAPTPTED